ncbi:uncharacterized protein LOC124999462 [Mugil cephalus]|uniref:uncharacterized protein LOC124999462 n=1 Tax=Mugil cephalus TaxID=48193 RepID=UPI001FB577A6|nr:uncharacterized protein LOC124999462 [Mugil cephalus]
MATKTSNAMDQTTSPREEDPPPTTVDTIRPIVDSFFKWIEPKQWEHLLSGNPDDETRYMLAEMLSNMMALIIESTLAEVARRGVKPPEYLSSSLGDALPRAFAQVLDVPDEVCHESSDSLRSIMATEAAACVNSMYFVRTNPVHPYRKYTTTLMTVDEMVDRAIKMLQECTEKKRAISRHSPLQPKCSPGTSTPRHTQEDQEDTESTKSDVTERVEDRPAPDHNVSLMSRIKRFFKSHLQTVTTTQDARRNDDPTQSSSGGYHFPPSPTDCCKSESVEDGYLHRDTFFTMRESRTVHAGRDAINMMALIIESTLARSQERVKPPEYLSSSLGDALPERSLSSGRTR